MKDKIIGLFVIVGTCVAIIVLVSDQAGVSPLAFVSAASFLFVAGFGGGLTYMRKNKYSENELITVLKNNLILGGWMGFIVGMIFVLSDSVGTDSLGPGMSASAVTLLYGYIGGYLIEAFYEK